MKAEPVLSRGVVAAALTLLIAGLRLKGVELPGDFSESATDAVLSIGNVAAILWAAVSARGKVTPVSDPKVTVEVPLVASEPHDVDDSE